MSWANKLYQTYENNIGKGNDVLDSLTPIAHMNANAQIEVTINLQGEFYAADIISKENAVTLIPVTEESSGRSSGVAPHALCDTLSYIAGDYTLYCEGKKEKQKAEEKYEMYMDELAKWAWSSYTHNKVKAVHQYLKKRELIADLIQAGIVSLSETGALDNKKVSGQPYEKTLVRFRVIGDDSKYGSGTWMDPSLIHMYTQYYLSRQAGREDVCYITGETGVVSTNHPKGIVSANYGAKLVSANDIQGYTYRGRFQNAEQAFALSYEASQKIHSALTWLIKKQGVYAGSQDKRVFICWNPGGKKIPDVLDLFSTEESDQNTGSQVSYRKKLIKLLQGYMNQFDGNEDIVIMALDAATTGRLSITYYNEMMASEFWMNILHWGETCRWTYKKYAVDKGVYLKQETPIFRRIVLCAFGRERGNYMDVDDKILKEQIQRLLKCMLENQPFPRDILQALIIRASNPLAYSKNNRELVLSTACAAIQKYYYDHQLLMKGESDIMKLDLENRDRSYLFGRLLAVYESVEKVTYIGGESRDPNAVRLQSAYVNHPMQTWKVLEDVVKPYFQKLTPASREYFRRLISNIVGLFTDEDESCMNQSLTEKYLLGYYLQREELYMKKAEQKEEKEYEQFAE